MLITSNQKIRTIKSMHAYKMRTNPSRPKYFSFTSVHIAHTYTQTHRINNFSSAHCELSLNTEYTPLEFEILCDFRFVYVCAVRASVVCGRLNLFLASQTEAFLISLVCTLYVRRNRCIKQVCVLFGKMQKYSCAS